MSCRRGRHGECTEPAQSQRKASAEPAQNPHRARSEPAQRPHRARSEPAQRPHRGHVTPTHPHSAKPSVLTCHPTPPAAQAAFADITALFTHYTKNVTDSKSATDGKSVVTDGTSGITDTESAPEMLQQAQFVTLAQDTGLAGEESFPLSRILALYSTVVLPVSIEAAGKGGAGKVKKQPYPYPYPYP